MALTLSLLLAMPLAFTVMSHVVEERSGPRVCSRNAGCMRGRYLQGHKIFEAFLGVPYALPPVGELRFKSPKWFPVWSGDYNAFEAKPDCIQKNYLLPNHAVSGSEDCLYLNVYRPVRWSISRKLPVMIYIFGGGWFSGAANPGITGPEYIMETEEVILVTISYRLGAFGFLSTGDEVIPGNFGLKDQRLAIRWVKDNIEVFGGNPNKLTLIGQSVGGVSAHMHMLSHGSEGLFQGVIAMSGTANVPFAINDKPLEQALRVAESCGIKNARSLSSQELLQALQNVNVNDLLQAGDDLKTWDVDPISNYRPVVEPLSLEDAFFRYHPDDILSSGEYQPVPFMLGFVPEEGAVRAVAILESPELIESFNSDFYNILEALLEFPPYLNEQQRNESMAKIIDEYFQGELEINENNRLGFLQLVTERGFHYPLYNTVKDYVNTVDTHKYPIYLYSFNYKGPLTNAVLYTGGKIQHKYGVIHADDLIYLLRSSLLFPDFYGKSLHKRVSQMYVDNFVHFAKFQKPRSIPGLEKCTASSFQRSPGTICDYQLFQNANNSLPILTVDNKFNTDHMHFWDGILANNRRTSVNSHN